MVIKMLGSKQLPGKASFSECACTMQRGKSSKLRHSRRSRETVFIACESDQITENQNFINIRTGPCACEAMIYIARNRVVCFLSSGKLISFEQKHFPLEALFLLILSVIPTYSLLPAQIKGSLSFTLQIPKLGP